MNRLTPRGRGGRNQLRDVKVRLGSRWGAERDGGVRRAHVGGEPIGVGIDCHGLETLFMARPDDPQGDLAAVGDENSTQGGHPTFRTQLSVIGHRSSVSDDPE